MLCYQVSTKGSVEKHHAKRGLKIRYSQLGNSKYTIDGKSHSCCYKQHLNLIRKKCLLFVISCWYKVTQSKSQ